MENSRLKEYLKVVLEVEKRKFELEQLISKTKAQKYVCKLQNKEIKKDSAIDDFGWCLVMMAIFGIVGLLLGEGTTNSDEVAILTAVIGAIIGAVIYSSLIEKEEKELTKKNEEIEIKNKKITLLTNKKNEAVSYSVCQLTKVLEDTKKLLKKYIRVI